MLRQEEEAKEEIENKNNQSNNYNGFDFDFANIFSTASLWLTGRTRPTLYLPVKLARKYRMDKPCRVAFSSHKNGILVSFLCRNDNDANNDNGNN
jgi:hypothetical protein